MRTNALKWGSRAARKIVPTYHHTLQTSLKGRSSGEKSRPQMSSATNVLKGEVERRKKLFPNNTKRFSRAHKEGRATTANVITLIHALLNSLCRVLLEERRGDEGEEGENYWARATGINATARWYAKFNLTRRKPWGNDSG